MDKSDSKLAPLSTIGTGGGTYSIYDQKHFVTKKGTVDSKSPTRKYKLKRKRTNQEKNPKQVSMLQPIHKSGSKF